MRDRGHEHPKREVVVSDSRSGSVFVRRGAGCVIVSETEDLKLWHLAFFFEPLQFGYETLGALHVEIIRVEAAIPWIEVAFERLDLCPTRIAELLSVGDEFGVAAITHAGLARAVPQVAAR